MKKIILSIGFLIAMAGFSGTEAANINVNVNIGVQPAWGPVGYNYAAFYYFPDINVYYNVNQGMFMFPRRGRWVSARYLPVMYRNYDLYGLYKVVITDSDPWRFNTRHIHDYRHFRGNRNQIVIRNSHDNRYRDSRRNEVRWYDDNRGRGNKDKGRDRDYNNGRDKGRDNNGRYTASQRDNDRNGRKSDSDRNKNGHRRSDNKSDNNKRSERSNSRTDTKYVEDSRSEKSERSSERASVDRSNGRSSAAQRR